MKMSEVKITVSIDATNLDDDALDVINNRIEQANDEIEAFVRAKYASLNQHPQLTVDVQF